MRITAYVPCRNNESTLPEVLAALRDQTRPADQLLFINDHCTDRSPEIARGFGFEVHELVEKGGLSAGRNKALEMARGDVILGLDADVAAKPDYLAILEKKFEANPDVAGIGGRVDERYTDTAPDLWRAMHLPLHRGDQEQRDPRMLFGATTALRVAAARQVGGWDERFLTHYEDVDISNRLKAAGHHLLYAPSCRAWHLKRDTLDTVLRSDWSWSYYGFEHCFVDLPTWLSLRSEAPWQFHRHFRVQECDTPQLWYITLLAPWSFTVRDLVALRKNAPEIGDIMEVVQLAQAVLDRYGYGHEIVGWVGAWLRNLARSLDVATTPPGKLHPHILNRSLNGALQSIPNCTYCSACRAQVTHLYPSA